MNMVLHYGQTDMCRHTDRVSIYRVLHYGQTDMCRHTDRVSIYRVIQWGRSVFWDVMLSVIGGKKVRTNKQINKQKTNKQTKKCMILNGYRVRAVWTQNQENFEW